MATYAENRKASFDYEFLERFEAGIELLGFEVKAIRSGKASLASSHVIIRGNEAYIVGLHIEPYQVGNTPEGYDPDRTRRLLLTKAEILRLAKEGDRKGLTLVPVSLYNGKGKIKVSIALARGKKKADKRETIKKRESDREISRLLKH